MRLQPLLLLLLYLSQPLTPPRHHVSAETHYKHPNCTTPCDADNRCVATSCKQLWDACPANLSQVGSTIAVDESPEHCRETECSLGGCNNVTQQEVHASFCWGFPHCPTGVCRQETCCDLRVQVTCCEREECSVEFADCLIPEQLFLNDSSQSRVRLNKVAHTGTGRFPFYSQASVPPGQSCDSVRSWGVCTCNDGTNVPGCLSNDSATWAADSGGDSVRDNDPLPAGLRLTCIHQQPQPPAPPPLTPIVPPPASPSPPDGPAPPATPPAEPGAASPPPAAPAAPPPPAPDSSSGANVPSPPKKSSSAGWVVGIVVLVLAVALVAAGLALCGVIRWRGGSWRAMRLGQAYETMFTGQSYTPGLGRPPDAPGAPGVASAWAAAARRGWADLQHRVTSLWRRSSGRPAGGTHQLHQMPSHTGDDDDLFTLEDLRRTIGGGGHEAGWTGGTGGTPGFASHPAPAPPYGGGGDHYQRGAAAGYRGGPGTAAATASGAGTATAGAKEMELAPIDGRPRDSLLSGQHRDSAAFAGAAGGGGGGGEHVINTRPFRLSDDEEGFGGSGF